MRRIYLNICLSATFLLLINSSNELNSNDTITIPNCMKYYTYNNETKICEHDNFLPIDFMKLIEIIIVSVISMIATAAGVGGNASINI